MLHDQKEKLPMSPIPYTKLTFFSPTHSILSSGLHLLPPFVTHLSEAPARLYVSAASGPDQHSPNKRTEVNIDFYSSGDTSQ